MSDQLQELHRQHSAAQDKYTYFLLAVSASAVAFAIQKSDNLTITWSLIPLGIATLMWGLSFYFGVKNLIWIQAAISSNYSLLQLSKGVHPRQPDHPQLVDSAKNIKMSQIDNYINKAYFNGNWQFRLILAGAVFFIFWHVLEMIIRTNS